MGLGQKEYVIGDSKFLIKSYGCDKWLTVLGKLTKILSKPASLFFKEGLNAKGAEGKFVEALGSIFENVSPEELPALLDELTEDVDWKKTGSWTKLNEVKDIVFLENKSDRFKICKEVLFFNYQKEIGRFFGSLPSMESLMTEAGTNQAQNTSSQSETRIKAR